MTEQGLHITQSRPPEPPGDFSLTLGEQLQKARHNKGLDLSDVAQITHVRREHLNALDEGRYDDLPEDIYSRNFLRLYAQTVGLDERATLDLYLTERRRALGISMVEREPTVGPPPVTRPGRERRRVGGLSPLLPTLLLIAIVILAALWGFNRSFFRTGSPAGESTLPSNGPAAASQAPATISGVTGSSSNAPAPAGADAAGEAGGQATAEAAVGGGAIPVVELADLGETIPLPSPPQEGIDVALSIETDPPGASVEIDGFALPGVTPIRDAVVSANQSRRLRITLDGYEPFEQSYDLSSDRAISLALVALPPSTEAGVAEGGVVIGDDQVLITITETTWLEVYQSTARNQGERLVYATVEPGDSYLFDLPVYLHVGNAGGVELSVDGQELGSMGSRGAVVGRAFER